MLRRLGRTALRAWGRTGKAPGYHYMAVERYGPALAGREPLGAALPNGCRVRCDLRDHVQRHQWFFGAYEPVESYLFTKLLRPGMTVVDAGANVGQYTLLAATAVGPAGSVHAFEPVPRNFSRLREAVGRNGLANVRLNRAALWREATTLRLGLPPGQEGNAGGYGVVAAGPGSGAAEARAVRLDDYVESSGIRRVDLIKMDVEGSEPFALEGARAVLGRDRPVLLMEVNRASLAGLGSSPEALAEQLRPLGYRTWRIGDSAAVSGPVAEVAGLDRANVLLHRDDLPPEVTGGWGLRTALRWACGNR